MASAPASAQNKDRHKSKVEKHRHETVNDSFEKRRRKPDKDKVEKQEKMTARGKNKAHEKKLKANKGNLDADDQKRKEKGNNKNK